MTIAELEHRRVAIWGYGREGRAALAALRSRLGRKPLTLFCSAVEAEAARALGDPELDVRSAPPDADALAAFEVVIKSPGISPYREPALSAAQRGVRFTSGTALWFAENPGARTVCVTGTKGKSTTTALIAHLLRAAGHRTALAGNIGLPLLDLLDIEPEPAFWAIELSSYQTRDARSPEVAVVVNVFPEHLDWHGGEARYVADKLALLVEAGPRHVVLPDGDARLLAHAPDSATVHRFGRVDGWHLREDALYRGEERLFELSTLRLPGLHNRGNLLAALAAIEALGIDARPLARHAADFAPLPHRLQRLGVRQGLEYVDDSISTTPHASIAALSCFRDRDIAVIVGGYDRGLDWGVFAEHVSRRPPKAVIAQGDNGERIVAALGVASRDGPFSLELAHDLDDAVRRAERALGTRGVVLLSPGAPSFPRYRDYAERGRHFARIAGFDADATSAIPGLGIA